MSKEEKAAEMARRKEERKQVKHTTNGMGDCDTNRFVLADCYAQGTKERGEDLSLIQFIYILGFLVMIEGRNNGWEE